MQELIGVSNIIFDLGGVILNIDYHVTLNEFKKLGIDRFDEIFSQYTQSSLSDDFEVGKISELEFYESLKVASGKDFSMDEYRLAWNAMLLDLPKKRVEVLKKLSKKYRLFLFSNTNETHYASFINKVESDFDSIFESVYYSHHFGHRKPNQFAFQTILDLNNLVAKETLFIDDSFQHIQSADSLGINTILIQDKPIDEILNWE